MNESFDPEIYDLYSRTTYSVRDEEGREVFFTPRQASESPLLKRKFFVVLTAWNPMNKRLGTRENRARNRLLEMELKKTPYVFYPTLGTLEEHREESFTVEGMPESEGARLGALFEQYAILVNDSQGCRLVRCPAGQS